MLLGIDDCFGSYHPNDCFSPAFKINPTTDLKGDTFYCPSIDWGLCLLLMVTHLRNQAYVFSLVTEKPPSASRVSTQRACRATSKKQHQKATSRSRSMLPPLSSLASVSVHVLLSTLVVSTSTPYQPSYHCKASQSSSRQQQMATMAHRPIT